MHSNIEKDNPKKIHTGITEFLYDRNMLGEIRYFKGDRLFNDKPLYEFNKGKIKAKELVTYDSALMNLWEITKDEIEDAIKCEEQIVAIIIRPGIERDYDLENSKFDFCGYDLVEITTGISAITNCGAMWGKALNYNRLNEFGLFPDYRQAVMAQLDLVEKFPEESHAYCEIIEIWRILY